MAASTFANPRLSSPMHSTTARTKPPRILQPHRFPASSPFLKPHSQNLSFHSSPCLPRRPSPAVFSSSAISCARRPEYVPDRISDPNYVRIFDTTLRDGEQSPGATMTSKEKLDIARQISKLGVDIIEAGFPASSPDDFEAVKAIALDVGNAVDEEGYVPVICGLSRCNEKDIRAAWEAVKFAKRPRIHTFIATSGIHMEYKLKKSKEEVIDIARRMVGFARSLGCQDVEFSPEDAGRLSSSLPPRVEITFTCCACIRLL